MVTDGTDWLGRQHKPMENKMEQCCCENCDNFKEKEKSAFQEWTCKMGVRENSAAYEMHMQSWNAAIGAVLKLPFEHMLSESTTKNITSHLAKIEGLKEKE